MACVIGVDSRNLTAHFPDQGRRVLIPLGAQVSQIELDVSRPSGPGKPRPSRISVISDGKRYHRGASSIILGAYFSMKRSPGCCAGSRPFPRQPSVMRMPDGNQPRGVELQEFGSSKARPAR